MNLSQRTVEQYKRKFPNETFRTISQKTGIQQTRLFRIFNGLEMKVSEYELLAREVYKSQHVSFANQYKTFSIALEQLSEVQINELLNQIQYKIKINQLLSKNYFSKNNNLNTEVANEL